MLTTGIIIIGSNSYHHAYYFTSRINWAEYGEDIGGKVFQDATPSLVMLSVLIKVQPLSDQKSK